jgi:DNA-binding SARP family transcriptional activator
MLRLRTFGGLSLARDEEAPMTGAPTQRRRLAILAMLAVARDRGVSRDKLLGTLWPESEQEKARHTLNQLLYAQRRHFDDQELFAGKKNLRLNRDVIRTDVGEFEDAFERNDFERAVSLYAGPFLDGFFLAGSIDFERWADDHRRRLAGLCRTALVALARRASSSGLQDEAARWWQRAFDLDPLDSQITVQLVEALATAGDTAGALRCARRHVERIRDELELDPDDDLVAVMRRLGWRGEPRDKPPKR